MTIRPIDIAKALDMSRQAVNGFIQAGMPTDSVESAQAWYNSRRAARGADAIGAMPTGDNVSDESFAEIVAQHRSLKDRAYRQYLEDLDNRDKNQSKSYATYDKLLKTMVSLEREAVARDIASRKYVETAQAVSVFGKILLALRNDISQLGTRVAAKANDQHPGMAMKAIDDEVDKLLRRHSQAADDSIADMQVPDEPKPEVNDVQAE
jgi:hypothetical protein